MTTDTMIVVSLIALTVTMISHIFVIARWSGRVDARLEDIINQPSKWSSDLTAMGAAIRSELTTQVGGLRAELAIWSDEVKKLREARHNADGKIQIHEGKFQAYDRIIGRLDNYIDFERGRNRNAPDQ